MGKSMSKMDMVCQGLRDAVRAAHRIGDFSRFCRMLIVHSLTIEKVPMEAEVNQYIRRWIGNAVSRKHSMDGDQAYADLVGGCLRLARDYEAYFGESEVLQDLCRERQRRGRRFERWLDNRLDVPDRDIVR